MKSHVPAWAVLGIGCWTVIATASCLHLLTQFAAALNGSLFTCACVLVCLGWLTLLLGPALPGIVRLLRLAAAIQKPTGARVTTIAACPQCGSYFFSFEKVCPKCNAPNL